MTDLETTLNGGIKIIEHGLQPSRITKTTCLIFALVFLPLLAVVTAILVTIGKSELDACRDEQQHTVDIQAASIASDIQLISSDLLVCAYRESIARLWDDNGVLLPAEIEKFTNDNLNLSKYRQLYHQIRLIDKTGMEISRVNFVQGSPEVVPKERLQNKKGRYYFDQAIRLSRGEVFVSPFDLNVEGGEIERPFEPVIRVATPVYDRHGRKQGILLFNYFGSRMLERFAGQVDSTDNSRSMLLNADGYWLKGPNPEDEWGFMFEDRKDRTAAEVYPEAWKQITAVQSAQFETASGLFTSRTVYPLLEGQIFRTGSNQEVKPGLSTSDGAAYHWKVVSFVPSEDLYHHQNQRLSLALFLLILVALILWPVSRRLVLGNAERKLAELKANQLAGFARNNPAPVIRTEMDGSITLINRAARLLFQGDVNGKPIQSLLPEAANIYLDLKQSRGQSQFEQLLGDQLFLFSVNRDQTSRSVFLYGSNITEIRRLEKLEFRAARLETAGTIAGQVAHDFNNLLAPLMAYPEFIREELPDNHPTLSYLDQIEKAASKIADINQQLLTLSRRGHYTQKIVNLNKVVQQAATEVIPLAGEVSCTTDLEPALGNIFGGSSQIHRVVSNLLTNALDSIQGIGQISVTTENYQADDFSGVYGRVPKGEYVKLTVADTGCGIPDQIVQKILDPFFTTKATDQKRGSGLGLSVVDAVVKDHHGYLDLKTEIDVGTSFYVYFPITSRCSGSESTDDISGGSERILVVDDDTVQREVSTRLLEKLGYQVDAVQSGEKAIDLLLENKRDLVIIDMIMPGGMDGAETIQEMFQINPDQRTIIVSGFSETDRVEKALSFGAGAFVQKPLTRKAIAAAVRKELEKFNTLSPKPLGSASQVH